MPQIFPLTQTNSDQELIEKFQEMYSPIPIQFQKNRGGPDPVQSSYLPVLNHKRLAES